MKEPEMMFMGVDLEHYVRLLARQKWFILIPAITAALIATVYSLTLKNLYTAKATVLVEPATLPEKFLPSTVPFGPEFYVRTLRVQVESRSRLETIIQEHNLYPELRKSLSMDEVIALMRTQMAVDRRGQDTFSISFIGEEPAKVRDVANAITDLFIQENLNYRLDVSRKNVRFLEREAKGFRDSVSKQERQIQEFRSKNLDRLPEQLSVIQQQLGIAQQQLQVTSDSLAQARALNITLRDRVDQWARRSGGVRTEMVASPSAAETQLGKARAELESLRSQYSERHPDVKAKAREVELLSAQAAQALASEPTKPRTVRGPSPAQNSAQEQLELNNSQIARLETENQRIADEIIVLKERLTAIPKVELEIGDLTKGLAVLREQSDEYQQKAINAAASMNLEASQYGSQFRALDRATLPEKPVSPNRPLIIMFGACIGFVLGVGVMLGLDYLFRPFLDEKDLARYTCFPVLVSIPHVGPFPSEWTRFRSQMTNLIGYFVGAMPFREDRYHATRPGPSPMAPAPSPLARPPISLPPVRLEREADVVAPLLQVPVVAKEAELDPVAAGKGQRFAPPKLEPPAPVMADSLMEGSDLDASAANSSMRRQELHPLLAAAAMEVTPDKTLKWIERESASALTANVTHRPRPHAISMPQAAVVPLARNKGSSREQRLEKPLEQTADLDAETINRQLAASKVRMLPTPKAGRNTPRLVHALLRTADPDLEQLLPQLSEAASRQAAEAEKNPPARTRRLAVVNGTPLEEDLTETCFPESDDTVEELYRRSTLMHRRGDSHES